MGGNLKSEIASKKALFGYCRIGSNPEENNKEG
jgi:hypothetical protein